MTFEYSSRAHVRRHGPSGYPKYPAYKPWLRDEFTFRCAYCLVREIWHPNEQASFSTDHLIPQVVAPNQVTDYDNLIYACTRCNSWKQDNDVLDPCEFAMGEHLRVNVDGTIEALSTEALEHIGVLGLDDPVLTRFRGKLLRTLKRLQNLPEGESTEALRLWLCFPAHLPNLSAMRPPGGNTRPEGIVRCYYELRKAGHLPEMY